jgi:Tol biopolymer transport system component/DNA-binding winged helix-turn-helix (wHTH) protein
MPRQAKYLFEFGPFRLIPAESLLLRDGQPVPLSPKPFEVLQLLVENHGHLLDKDEMMKRLWPDSFVEEANLAKYVFTVREVLGGERNGSKYIQTLPKRGYRFIAPVRVLEAESGTEVTPEALAGVAAPRLARLEGRKLWLLLSGVALLVFGVTTLAWFRWGTKSAPAPEPRVTRVTALSGNIGSPALSPDGKSIVFPWEDQNAEHSGLFLLQIGSTTPLRLTYDRGLELWPTWSPDGSQIAFLRQTPGNCGIYVIPALGGPERKLIDLRADRYFWLAWSPDGKTIAFTERDSVAEPHALALLSVETLERRRLSQPAGTTMLLRFAFSPDSSKIAAIIGNAKGIGVQVRSIPSGHVVTLLEGQKEWFSSVVWHPDGKHLIVSANQKGVRRLWKLPLQGGDLEPLAFAGEDAFFPSVSPDGKRLVFVHEFHDWDLWRIALGTGQVQSSAPFLSSTRLDWDPAFSPDGTRIAFASERSGTRELWVGDSDGSNALQLTSLGGPQPGKPSWSPDGRHIAFHVFDGGGIRVVPGDGGPLRTVFKEYGEFPSWSAHGHWVYFSRGTNGVFRIWKVPAEGGSAVQVTQGEGLVAQEDPEGVYLYFSKVTAPGIWRMPVKGGEETPVIPDFSPALSGYWKVAADGIYYVMGETRLDRTVVHRVNFFHLASRRTSVVATLSGALEPWYGGMSISPDGRSIVYSQRAYQSSEIMLVENLR